MRSALTPTVEAARQAALEVLRHNARGPIQGLPRTAGWGYPEPYTRDLMVAALGILVSGREDLIASLRRVLLTLARHQTRRAYPGWPMTLRPGRSDTTPLFLIGLALFRQATGEADFLAEARRRL
jgi:hypothetical protein